MWIVEIGTEVAQFPEKEYINGIFVAVFNMIQARCCYITVDSAAAACHKTVLELHNAPINKCAIDCYLVSQLHN
jgi:hypothetical protein